MCWLSDLFKPKPVEYTPISSKKASFQEVNHCQLKQTAFPYPAPTRAGEKYGRFTTALPAIMPAATVSAGAENPQDTQENRD
jgi:hypothetical protein